MLTAEATGFAAKAMTGGYLFVIHRVICSVGSLEAHAIGARCACPAHAEIFDRLPELHDRRFETSTRRQDAVVTPVS